MLWSTSGTATVLRDVGGQGFSQAVAINAAGQSVGTASNLSPGANFVGKNQSKGASDLGERIVACYKEGNDTVSTMYACSGQWVTSRILTLCFLEADPCPVIPDTGDGPAVVATAIGGDNPLAAKLTIDMAYVLAVPDRPSIEFCKSTTTTEPSFEACVTQKMSQGGLAALLKCASETTDQARALCLTKDSPTDVAKLVECVSGGAIDMDAISKCIPGYAAAWAKVQSTTKCVQSSPGNAGVDCLLSNEDASIKRVAKCLGASSDNASAAAKCLAEIDPKAGAQISEISCAANAKDEAAIAACVRKDIGGDGAKVAACAAGDKDKIVSCLFGDRPNYRAASTVVTCIQGGRDPSALIANCSNLFIKDAKTRAVLACVTHAASDTQQLVGCAASSVLPPEVARYAACAANSTGPTSFGLCAVGPVMNEEWRIASECAVQTGGNPLGFAGCTAGRLTLRELTKCFTGGSCYGPDNTIVRAFTTAFNDLLHGPGANNDIIVALHKLEQVSGGPNSVINNPGQIFGGDNSVFRKPGQIAGGEHSAVNEFLRTPLGGHNSVINQVLEKPLGGPNSVPNQVLQKPLGGPNSVPNKVIEKVKRCLGLC